MPHAEYELRAQWEGANLGQFTIDYSTLDGPDTLGASFATDFDGPYDDLTPYLHSASWSYGRTSGSGPMGRGTGNITLKDRDGLFNPSNPDSPLAGLLIPMRPIQLRSTYAGTTRGCFLHFIDEIVHNPNPGVRETTITTFDLFEWLGRFLPTFTGGQLVNTGGAIAAVLDAVFWTEPGMRSLGHGDDFWLPDADATRTALELILDDYLAIDPGGMFYIDGPTGPGRAVYKSRHDLLLATIAATFTDIAITDVSPGTASKNIRNRFTVTRTDGAPQTATNPASRFQYSQRDGDSVESPLLHDDAHAANLAAELGRLYGDPLDPVRDLTVRNGTEALLLEVLTRDLGDRVAVAETGGGTDGDFIIQQASHTVEQKGRVHTASYALTRHDPQVPFVIDGSLLDSSTDKLVF